MLRIPVECHHATQKIKTGSEPVAQTVRRRAAGVASQYRPLVALRPPT